MASVAGKRYRQQGGIGRAIIFSHRKKISIGSELESGSMVHIRHFSTHREIPSRQGSTECTPPVSDCQRRTVNRTTKYQTPSHVVSRIGIIGAQKYIYILKPYKYRCKLAPRIDAAKTRTIEAEINH